MCWIGDNTGCELTVTEVVVENVHPPCVTVYVIVFVPIVAFAGQNWFPVTPGPENVPPAGVPVSVTQGSVEQNGPRAVIVGITCNINTLTVTGVDWHPPAFDATTVIALLIRPGDAEDQLTLIVFVP